MLKQLRKELVLFFAFLLFGSLSFAQETTAILNGLVTDNADKPVLGAIITVKHEPTGFVSTTVTNKKGLYVIPNLKVGGPYTIKVSFVGYKNEELKDLNLQLGNNPYMNFKLLPSTTELQNVTVTTTAARNRAAAIGTVSIGNRQLSSLPTLGRSLSDFTRLSVQSNNNSFAGSNFRYNNFTLDGAINNDAIGFSNSFGGVSGGGQAGTAGAGTRTNPYSIESIQEVQVQIAPYDVKLGNFTGGSVNAVTKSGTNEVHGSVYGYGRNSWLVGKSPDGLKKKIDSKFHEYQTGFSLGGPIVKNKIFYYVNAELTRREEPSFYNAGDPGAAITLAQAQAVRDTFRARGLFDPGTYDQYYINTSSDKIFAKLDFKLNDKNSLMVRAIYTHGWGNNLERTSTNFQFSSTDFTQHTKNLNLVGELKTKISDNINNQFMVSYINVHEYRDFPKSSIAGIDASPFVDIGNGAWWLGTWREASVYNMHQSTFEITDNLTLVKGINKFTIGTHNELYNLDYGFINSWNGRWEYSSGWNSFLANTPSRVRAAYTFDANKNNLDALKNEVPGQNYKVDLLSAYVQDELSLGKNFKLTPGVRFDYSYLVNKFPLDPQLAAINTYGYVNSNPTFTHTPFNQLNNQWLGKLNISPRLGFNWDIKGNQTLVLRGGSGIFIGRMPFAWLGYAATLSGQNIGSIDKKNPGTVALINNPQNIQSVLPTGAHEVDIVDNNFKLPRILRSNLAVDYRFGKNKTYKLTVDVLYTKTLYDVQFQQIAVKDSNVTYTNWGPTKTPIYPSSTYNSSNLSNIYMLTNTTQGYRYNFSVQLSKIANPISLKGTKTLNVSWMAGYTYGMSKDVSNGIRNSFQSNYELNPSINPNRAELNYSNFDLRHRIVGTITGALKWNDYNTSSLAFFYNGQSGNPYTLIYTSAPFNNKNNAPLCYIPTSEADAHLVDNGSYTASQQWQDLNNFISNDKYLKNRRGQYAERNGLRTPWNHEIDMKLMHEFKLKNKNTITLTFDIFNLANLINNSWGRIVFVTNVNNYTVNFLQFVTSGAATQNGTAVTASAQNPYFKFLKGANNGQYYTNDPINSRWQGQFGIKYTF